MFSRKPTLRVAHSVILFDVVVIRRKDEGAVLLQIDHHDAEPGRMARRVEQSETLEKVYLFVGKGFPIQLIQCEIIRQIQSRVSSGGRSPARVFELLFVYVNYAPRSKIYF